MKTIIIIATAVTLLLGSVSVFGSTSVFAQGGSATGQPAASGAGSVPQAPIGHRQPRRDDVPAISDDQAKIDAADRALDKKIRSICRGC